MSSIEKIGSRWSPQLLSILRIVSGFLFIQHGTQKWFSFPVPGPESLEFFSRIGIAGALEIVGGALIIVGLFTRPVAFILSGQMAFAYFLAHAPRGFWTVGNGGDAAVMFCFAFLYMAAVGGGPWSLDKLRGAA